MIDHNTTTVDVDSTDMIVPKDEEEEEKMWLEVEDDEYENTHIGLNDPNVVRTTVTEDVGARMYTFKFTVKDMSKYEWINVRGGQVDVVMQDDIFLSNVRGEATIHVESIIGNKHEGVEADVNVYLPTRKAEDLESFTNWNGGEEGDK